MLIYSNIVVAVCSLMMRPWPCDFLVISLHYITIWSKLIVLINLIHNTSTVTELIIMMDVALVMKCVVSTCQGSISPLFICKRHFNSYALVTRWIIKVGVASMYWAFKNNIGLQSLRTILELYHLEYKVGIKLKFKFSYVAMPSFDGSLTLWLY